MNSDTIRPNPQNYIQNWGTSKKQYTIEDLHKAIEMNNLSTVNKILRQDYPLIDINELVVNKTMNGHKYTAIMLGTIKGNIAIINALLAKGANPNIVSGQKKSTPLHVASGDGGRLDILKALLQNESIDVNIQDNLGRTPLIIAYIVGDSKRVKELLKHGADVNVPYGKGTLLDEVKATPRLLQDDTTRAIIEYAEKPPVEAQAAAPAAEGGRRKVKKTRKMKKESRRDKRKY